MTLYKRGKIWHYYIVVDGRKKRGSTKCIDKRSAEKVESKVRSKLILGGFDVQEKKGQKNLQEIQQDFIKYRLSRQKEESTKVRTKSRFAFFIDFTKDFALSNVNRKTIENYVTHRQKFVRNKTINFEIALIKDFFKYCLLHKYLKVSPVLEFDKLPTTDKRITFYSTEELKKIFSFDDFPRAPGIFRFLFLTGFRISDVYNLKWENINLKRRTISISMEKTEKEFNFPITEQLLTFLNKVPRVNDKVFGLLTPNDLKKGVYNYLRKRAIEIGIKEPTVHKLRHTFATQLLLNGVGIYEVSKLLGHSEIKMTEKYLHLIPTHLEDSLKKLPNL
jgi:integrase